VRERKAGQRPEERPPTLTQGRADIIDPVHRPRLGAPRTPRPRIRLDELLEGELADHDDGTLSLGSAFAAS
jgi:hypothetical protein